MKIAVACDHGGFALKQPVIGRLEQLGIVVIDQGAHQYDPEDDYPDYARYLGQAVQHGQADRGILLCGSGVGACVAANKLSGVRASVCHDTYSARQGVEHDDLNVLCLGARVVGQALAEELVQAFAQAHLSAEPRHRRRIQMIAGMEAGG